MPRKFTIFKVPKAGGNGTKTRRFYFTGPSAWRVIDENGQPGSFIRIPDGARFNKYSKTGDFKEYVRDDGYGNAVLNIKRLENAQRMGRVNRYPINNVGELPNLGQAAIHLRDIAVDRMPINSLTFQVRLAKYSMDLFLRSIAEMKFRDYGSKSWPPLSSATIRHRRRFGTNPRHMLVDTGALKSAIKIDGNVVYVDPNVVHKGSGRRGDRDRKVGFYASVHNFGDKHVPQRQYMGHSSYIQKEGWVLFKQIMFEELFTPIV